MQELQAYKTVEEKAIEWDITPRHVQHLCKNGKIGGVIKRAGAWFIPDDVPIPTKNTKAGTEGFRFVGTKNKVFDSAIELFMLKGYSNVSLKDIASRVGIRQSTIYNHFKSKQEILDVIYDYYEHYFKKGRKSLEEMEPLVKNADAIEIIGGIRYDFDEEYSQRLSSISKILFQRIAVDERARQIGKTLIVDEGIKYVQDVFNRGIEFGRFAPFDTRTVSVFINSVRMFTMYNWIVDPSPENMSVLAEQEKKLYEIAAAMLPDLARANKSENVR